jgi:hypothetical protein
MPAARARRNNFGEDSENPYTIAEVNWQNWEEFWTEYRKTTRRIASLRGVESADSDQTLGYIPRLVL